MTDAALYRLMTWLSPAYPIGAFSYSHGLEWMVESGVVTDADGLRHWLAGILVHGGGRNDAVLLAHSWRAAREGDGARLAEVAELAAAFAPSRERHLETTAQGKAFLVATRAAWPCRSLDALIEAWDGPMALPIVIGCAAAGHGVPLEATLLATLHSIASNLVGAGVRLIPLGQTDGQHVVAALETPIAEVAAEACDAPLESLGGMATLADIASMRHETQHTRLFRS